MKTAFLLLVILTVLTGLFYPLTITAFAQFFFPARANGSLLEQQGKIMGSAFIGQAFSSPHYFWGRPSETRPYAYNGQSSSGSNSGPSNPDFLARVQARISYIKQSDVLNSKLIPIDLITASASGLDPEISPSAAFYQVSRIARERRMPERKIYDLVVSQIKHRSWGLLGEPRVNVVQLNLALDNL